MEQRGPIVHLSYGSQAAVCESMVRIQEFYESPIKGIRGHVFGLAEYVEANKAANGGKYVYDWDGFNVPGHVVREFFATFSYMSPAEDRIKTILSGIGDTDFYLIATHAGDPDADVLDHEIMHALWYLHSRYHTAAVNNVCDFAEMRPDAYAGLRVWLSERGYDESVFADEIHAYLGTTPEAWWTEPEQGMDPVLATRLWNAGAIFREMRDLFVPPAIINHVPVRD